MCPSCAPTTSCPDRAAPYRRLIENDAPPDLPGLRKRQTTPVITSLDNPDEDEEDEREEPTRVAA
ncbi:hypothetical protein TPA0909_44180 [Streptomyces albus]|nr:hypothetical protein TPA0909_44180 [Streptomyces albus]